MLKRILSWLKWFIWWLLKLFGLASPHPAIRKYWREKIDVSEAKKAVEEGRPLQLKLGETLVDLQLEPAPVSSDEIDVVTINDEGEEETFSTSNLVTYKGRVEKYKDSFARLTITERVLMGYVHTGEDWWFIEPMKKFDQEAQPDDYLVYRTRDTSFQLEYGDDGKPSGFDEDGGVEPPHKVNPTIGIAMWADKDYRSQADIIGINWWEGQAALINNINGIYNREVNIQFDVRIFVIHVGSVLSSSNADTLLDKLGVRVRAFHGDIREVSVRQNTGIEVAHLTSGKNLDGRTLGIAWVPGVWSLSQQQLYILSGGGGFGGGPNLSYQNMMIAAHELGHNFDGKHSEADKICVTRFLWCWDFERTLMWGTYHDDNRDDFSGSNRSRVQNNAQTGRNVRFNHS